MRLDKDWPEKVANNWDVVCFANEFTNGYKDYHRFEKKHKQLYGVCDDGAIEKGVGHVHAAFTEAEPEGISEGMNLFNEEMLMRSRNRDKARELWGIGQPFSAHPRAAIETMPNDDNFGLGQDSSFHQKKCGVDNHSFRRWHWSFQTV